MTPRVLQRTDDGTPLEVLPPVLYNTYKHHAVALRLRLDDAAAAGEAALPEVLSRLAVLGGGLMDMYAGALSPREVSGWVLDELRRQGRLELDAYGNWLAGQGAYAVVTHPGDNTDWVLRLGDEQGRYVHLHPGRWSPNTTRVRANVVKTAFFAVLHTRLFGGDPTHRRVLNEARQRYLGLPPLGRAPAEDAGQGAFLTLLNSR
jgi:hypothetical protein